MKKIIFVSQIAVSLAMVQFLGASAFADDENESYTGYNSIVRELSSSHYSSPSDTTDSLDTIRFHFGFGLINSRISLNLPKNLPQQNTLHGYEARFGIDLFSPEWLAEVIAKTYDPDRFSDGEMSMKEFDLMVVYHSTFEKLITYNAGAGLGARYLDFSGIKDVEHSNTTPSAILTAGFGVNITSMFNVGLLFTYNSPMVTTADNGSFDGGLTFAGQF